MKGRSILIDMPVIKLEMSIIEKVWNRRISGFVNQKVADQKTTYKQFKFDWY